MSRDKNRLRQHVDDCLAERQEMRDWLRRARQIAYQMAYVDVTERDWLFWGDVEPAVWLHDSTSCEDSVDYLDDWDNGFVDWTESDWQDLDDELEWDRIGREYMEDILRELDDWRDEEPYHAEFGGREYPREHVESAKAAIRVD